MDSHGSVSRWIRLLPSGSETAADELWRRFRPQLLGAARRLLGRSSRRVRDEEDVVVAAFHSLLRRAKAGEYPELTDRDQLWRLLLTITANKARNQVRDERRLRRRPGDAARRVLDLDHLEHDQQPVSPAPQPDLVADVMERLQRLLESLDDPELRRIAIGKLMGMSNEEIADEVQRSLSTVERRLRLIRSMWGRELA